MELIRVVIDNL